MSFIDIDLGTSGVKVVLMHRNGSIIRRAVSPLIVSRPQSGWVEQKPDQWIQATGTALAQLASKHNLTSVVGIGRSGQMHGALLLDSFDQVPRSAILWNDTRSGRGACALFANPPIFKTGAPNIE